MMGAVGGEKQRRGGWWVAEEEDRTGDQGRNLKKKRTKNGEGGTKSFHLEHVSEVKAVNEWLHHLGTF